MRSKALVSPVLALLTKFTDFSINRQGDKYTDNHKYLTFNAEAILRARSRTSLVVRIVSTSSLALILKNWLLNVQTTSGKYSTLLTEGKGEAIVLFVEDRTCKGRMSSLSRSGHAAQRYHRSSST